MPDREIDLRSSDGAQLVASLLVRIDGLMAQIAGRDERIDKLLAQLKASNARIAELEAKHGGPPKTPDNSSLPPSRGQKANAEPPAVRRRRKGRPGIARKLVEKPDATRRLFAEHCACGAVLSEAVAKEYNHIDIPPIRPITTRVELFRATCPCCKGSTCTPSAGRTSTGRSSGQGAAASTTAW
jgi:transposase